MSANIDMWADWSLPPILNAKGEIQPIVGNLVVLLENHESCRGVLGFDEFRQIKTKRKPAPWGTGEGQWNNVDLPAMRAWLSQQFGLNASTEVIDQSVIVACDNGRFDSLKNEVMLANWDGLDDRVDMFFTKYFGAKDTPYVRKISRMFLVSLIARALEPACKVDTMPILEGKQGVRKSSGLRALAGAQFFSDTVLDFANKDAMQSLLGVWLYELSELDSFSRKENTSVKAFLSKREDRYRPSYAREVIVSPRRVVFAGTTNEANYLSDATGARRFQPVDCTRVDVDAITRDRENLIAEAKTMYFGGEKWWYDEGTQIAQIAHEEQSTRQLDHAWIEPITQWLASRPSHVIVEGVTTYQLLTECLSIEKDKIRHSETMQVGKILSQLGYKKGLQVMRNGARLRPYYPPTNASDSQPARHESPFAANDY